MLSSASWMSGQGLHVFMAPSSPHYRGGCSKGYKWCCSTVWVRRNSNLIRLSTHTHTRTHPCNWLSALTLGEVYVSVCQIWAHIFVFVWRLCMHLCVCVCLFVSVCVCVLKVIVQSDKSAVCCCHRAPITVPPHLLMSTHHSLSSIHPFIHKDHHQSSMSALFINWYY